MIEDAVARIELTPVGFAIKKDKSMKPTYSGSSNWGPQACYFNSVLTNAGVNPSTNATLTVYLRLGTPCRDRFVSSGTLALLLKAGNQ
jgi:hypothetical protein